MQFGLHTLCMHQTIQKLFMIMNDMLQLIYSVTEDLVYYV